MMEDQLNKYVEYLQSQKYTVELEDEKIKIFTNIEGVNVVLWCSLGDYFPYEIPEIFLDKDSSKKLSKIPHLYTDNSLCIFDKSKVIPNFNEPQQLVKETIEESITVIQKGLTGENKKDFVDEFLEYWSTKRKLKAQMFVENVSEGKRIHCCFNKEEVIIADSSQRLKEIFKAITGKVLTDDKIFEGLFIPLKGDDIENIPRTDIEIVKMIERYSEYEKLYNSFMQKNIKRTVLIAFNQIVSGKNMIAGWIHQGPGIPKGFRKGHVDLKVAFAISEEKGAAVKIENCHQNRLFTRGGDGVMSPWKRVGIIGCGSVGSFIAEALKLSGVEKYVLVDNERLEYENIARHSCGYNGVPFTKACNVGVSLQQWNPNIIFDSHVENAHGFVENKSEVINECDIVFVAVASAAVEHHVNKLILENKITVPVVFVWTEPYSLGGHAVLVKKPQDLYEEIFDSSTFEYRYSIVKNGTEYLKREAGCQSTYMPYSGFLLQQFIYRMVDCLMTECWNKKGNYRITWCGKMSKAMELGVSINVEYENVEDYSMIIKRID